MLYFERGRRTSVSHSKLLMFYIVNIKNNNYLFWKVRILYPGKVTYYAIVALICYTCS
jgi:hypothetical protein